MKPNAFKYICLLFSLIATSTAFAAPGDLAERPLFLGHSVKSNIMLIADDSGSMGWRLLRTKEAKTIYPSEKNSGDSYFIWDHLYYFKYGDLFPDYDLDGVFSHTYQDCDYGGSCTSTTDEHTYKVKKRNRLELCSGYNALAFNPSIEYSAWPGCPGADGCPLEATNYSLRNHKYYLWNDDGDGKLQEGECSSSANAAKVVGEQNAATQENYRLWYSYYRDRMMVSKKAMGEVVKASDQRVGFMTINDDNIAAEVTEMATASGDLPNKTALLKTIYNEEITWAGTKLRSGLKRAGEHFASSNGPILKNDKGGSCQQNFAVLMTDGYWNGTTNPGVDNADRDGIKGDKTNKDLIRQSDSDEYSNTLADVAMNYYLKDLSTLDNNVPTRPGIDENSAQHLVTFGISFGVNGTLDANPTDPNEEFSWPDPKSSSAAKIDDLRHAAWVSRGQFLSAKDPDTLIESLKTAFEDIADRTGTAASVTFNSASLDSGSIIYVSQFSTSGWYGDLLAYKVDGTSGAIEDTPLWSAASILTDPANNNNQREVVTYNADSKKGVAFKQGQLSSLQVEDLKMAYDRNNSSNSGNFYTTAVDYMRGARNKEGRDFRQRNSRKGRLGDIINSSPVYVGGAVSNWPPYIEAGYGSYVGSVKNRKAIVYVGANDGMVHGFDAEDGSEVFAFVPHGIASTEEEGGMHYLLDKDYNHRYYVDGTPSPADAYVGGKWKTVLLGGLGAGGKSVYALDVTDPDSLKESNASDIVMWEFTSEDMGYSFAQPKVAKMNDGSWVAVVGNGYNNTSDGRAKIFLLDITTGKVIKEFDTEIGSVSSGACDSCNGMSTVSPLDIDGNGTADYLYAGDVQGNVWVINVGSDKKSEWVFDSQVTYNSDGTVQSYGGGLIEPLFVTKDSSSITTDLAVAPFYRQTRQNNHFPAVMVMFGSGQFMTNSDATSTRVEHFYGVMHTFGQNDLSIETSGDFVERTITNASVQIDGKALELRLITGEEGEEKIAYHKDPSDRQYGWYLPLPNTGERVIHSPKIVGDYVLFNTFFPSALDPCKYGAAGYLMAANYRTGLAPKSLLDFSRDGVIDEKDYNYAGTKIESPPAGISTLGSSGVGISEFLGPEVMLMDLMGRQPIRSSWTDVR